jgi:hypothetical protein
VAVLNVPAAQPRLCLPRCPHKPPKRSGVSGACCGWFRMANVRDRCCSPWLSFSPVASGSISCWTATVSRPPGTIARLLTTSKKFFMRGGLFGSFFFSLAQAIGPLATRGGRGGLAPGLRHAHGRQRGLGPFRLISCVSCTSGVVLFWRENRVQKKRARKPLRAVCVSLCVASCGAVYYLAW